jgi:nitrate/nitrite transporter NarK
MNNDGDDDAISRLAGLLFCLDAHGTPRSYRVQALHCTVLFFFSFGVTALFSPAVGQLATALSFSTQQISIIISMPTLTATVARIPLSLCVARFGTVSLLLVSQLVGLVGLLGLVGVLASQRASAAAFIVLGLVVGIAGAAFPILFIHTSFYTPKARQGVVLAVFMGLGTLGGPIVTLVLPFIIEGVGVLWTYVIWSFVQAGLVVYCWLLLRGEPFAWPHHSSDTDHTATATDPPYYVLTKQLDGCGAQMQPDWDVTVQVGLFLFDRFFFST